MSHLLFRGSSFLSRLAYYHPERFSKYAFLDVAYAPPRGHFSIDVVNEQSEKLLGYPVFGYWPFFNEPNAGELMDQKVPIPHLNQPLPLPRTNSPIACEYELPPLPR